MLESKGTTEYTPFRGTFKNVSDRYGLRIQPPTDYWKRANINMQVQSMRILDSDTPALSFPVASYDASDHVRDDYYQQVEEAIARKAQAAAEREEASESKTECDPGSTGTKYAEMIMTCVTDEGISVTLRQRYKPYIRVEIPAAWRDGDIESLLNVVAKRLRIPRVSISSAVEMLSRSAEYIPDDDDPSKPKKFRMLRIGVPTIDLWRTKLPYVFKYAMTIPGTSWYDQAFRVHEMPSPFQAVNCFYSDYDIWPSTSVSVPTAALTAPPGGFASHSQIEAQVRSWSDVKRIETEHVPPLLQAAYDLEQFSESGRFPSIHKSEDCLISCCISFRRMGAKDTKSVIFMNKRAPRTKRKMDPNDVIIQCEDEHQVVKEWRDAIVVHTDADLTFGWNNEGYDDPLLAGKNALWVCENEEPSRFSYLSRLMHESAPAEDGNFSSKAYGDRKSLYFPMPGRTAGYDLLTIIRREIKLRGYSLNEVSQHVLKQQKEDMKAARMFAIWRESRALDEEEARGSPNETFAQRREANDEDLELIALYNKGDCVLLLNMVDALAINTQLIAQALVSLTSFSDLIRRGQSIRVFNHLVYAMHAAGYAVTYPDDYVKKPFVKTKPGESKSAKSKEKGYEGAFVLDTEQTRGFYLCPVSVVDFQSLYPNIMKWKKLCWTTNVRRDEFLGKPGCTYETHQVSAKQSFTFVTHIKPVTETMIEKLLNLRKALKAEMKLATGFKKVVLNGRQLAVKIMANSIYGFTGFSAGMYPCMAVAAATTYVGRENLIRTIEVIEKYNKLRAVDISEDGLEWSYRADGSMTTQKVIYGDTDSAMFIYSDLPNTGDKRYVGPAALKVAWMRQREIAKHVTDITQGKISLEPEKVYMPYLLMRKKGYAGPKYDSEKMDHVDLNVSGLQVVRRDVTSLLSKTMENALNALLIDMNMERAYDIIEDMVMRLVEDRVAWEELTLSKSLGSNYADRAKVMQAIVADAIKERNPGSEPKSGDRVPYVYVVRDTQHMKSQTKVFQQVEDPTYAKEQGMKLDRGKYLEDCKKPLLEIFEFFTHEYSLTELFRRANVSINVQRTGTRTLFSMRGPSSIKPTPASEVNYSKKRKAESDVPGAPPKPTKKGNVTARSFQMNKAAPVQRTLMGGIAKPAAPKKKGGFKK